MKKIVVLFGLFIIFSGCSNHVQFKVDQVVPQQEVSVLMSNGKEVSGIVQAVEKNALVVTDENGHSWRAQKSHIERIQGPKPALDLDGKIISEKEIAQRKTHKNFWLYTISGGVLSMGTSFFLSSMASRSADTESRDPIIYGGTGAGTVVGTFLFARAGANRDRNVAIQKIALERANNKFQDSATIAKKKEKIEKEIQELKRLRAAQDAEIQALRQKIKEKQKEQ